MKYRKLGNTGIELSEIGYGCSALFGKDIIGKAGMDEEKAYSLIDTAVKNGVTFFDTGFNYGYAEERLGRCLSQLIGGGTVEREHLVIETKCGETLNEDGTYGPLDWSPDWIKKSVEISLKRLKIDYIDLLAMHGGRYEDWSDALLNTLSDMKSQGIIRAYGVNTFTTRVIEWINDTHSFDYVMLDYNVMRQDREQTIAKLNESGIGIIAGAALGQSLYSNRVFKIKSKTDLWYLLRAFKNFRGQMKKGREFRFLTKSNEGTANQLALRYVLDNPYIASAVFNTSSVEHLVENLKASDMEMSEILRKRIKNTKTTVSTSTMDR